jgi:predicted PurR-regulated permease PerM
VTLPEKSYLNRALEIFIHIFLVALLAAACFLVLSPFIAVVAWGLTIAIAGYPAYRRLQKLLGGRGGLAAVLFTVFLLTVLIVPVVMLSRTLIEGSQALPLLPSERDLEDSAATAQHRNLAPQRQTS